MEELRANPTSSISVKSKSELIIFKLISFLLGAFEFLTLMITAKLKLRGKSKRRGAREAVF